MKKRISVFGILSAGVAIASLVSCGTSTSSTISASTGSSSTSATSSSTSINVDWSKFKNPDNNTTITFWATMAEDDANLVAFINLFKTIYPGITIDYSQKGGYADVYTAVKQGIPAGNVPTMAYAYPDHVATYLYSNSAVMDMTAYMNDPVEGFGHDDDLKGLDIGGTSIDLHTDAGDMIQGYLEEGHQYVDNNGNRLNGYYSLPFQRSSEVMFYNKTMFTAHGWDVSKLETWEGLSELLPQMVASGQFPSDKLEARSAGPLAYDSNDNFFITLSQQLGIDYTDGTQISNQGNPFTFYTDSRSKTMTAKLNQMYQDKDLFTTNSNSGETYNDVYFQDGQSLALNVSSTAGTKYMIPGQNGMDENTEVGVVPLPKSTTDWVGNGGALNSKAKGDAVISQGPSVTFFRNATDDQKAAAWLFYKFATSDYMSAVWAASTGYEPVRDSSYNLPPFEATANTLYADVHDIVRSYGEDDRFFTSDVFVGSSEARAAVGQIFPAVFVSKKTGAEADAIIDAQYLTALTDAAKGLPTV